MPRALGAYQIRDNKNDTMLDRLYPTPTSQSRFIFDPRLRNGFGAFRDSTTGKIVSNSEIRAGAEAFIDTTQAVEVTRMLQSGEISLRIWQGNMRDLIRDGHLASYALGRGGWDSLTQADLRAVSEIVQNEWRYLDRFANQISEGTQLLDGTALVRANAYENSFFATYNAATGVTAEEAGFEEERSVLDPGAQHCGVCLDEAAKDWQPLGTLIPIGGRACMANDRCHMEYRTVTEDGQEVIV